MAQDPLHQQNTSKASRAKGDFPNEPLELPPLKLLSKSNTPPPIIEKGSPKHQDSPSPTSGRRDFLPTGDQRISSAPPEKATCPSAETKIPEGLNALHYARQILDSRLSSQGFFDVLIEDDPKTCKHPEEVLALQGLLRTVGYDQPMNPGFFDLSMRDHIVKIQENAVKKGLLPAYRIDPSTWIRVQMDSTKGDYLTSPGMVGEHSFSLLINLAENQLKR